MLLGNSHLYPKGPLFRESEEMLVPLSDFGLIATRLALWYKALTTGPGTLLFPGLPAVHMGQPFDCCCHLLAPYTSCRAAIRR